MVDFFDLASFFNLRLQGSGGGVAGASLSHMNAGSSRSILMCFSSSCSSMGEAQGTTAVLPVAFGLYCEGRSQGAWLARITSCFVASNCPPRSMSRLYKSATGIPGATAMSWAVFWRRSKSVMSAKVRSMPLSIYDNGDDELRVCRAKVLE